MDIEPADQCIVCDTLYNLQLCEECEEFVCHNKECLDPDSLSISTWICCLKCYQEKLSSEMEYHMNDGYLDKCMYCGNIFYNDQRGHQSLNYTTPKYEYEKKQPEIQNSPSRQACT